MDERASSFLKLLKIMDELREQCPWDKKQSIESIRHLTIEETYELSDAILKNDLTEIKKELGDILLHIVFYSRIASETKAFDIKDVIDSLCEKLIFRHPHIYGDVKAETEEQVKQNWEQLKQKEKGGNTSVLSGVPNSMPALLKAYRIQEKARAVGFDWDKPEQVYEKVKEELDEFEVEIKNKNQQAAEKEFGDVLFSLINYGRFLNINPEDALEQTNKKFIKRFGYMEEKVKEQGKQIADCKLEELDGYWNEAKKL
ncbi:MAG: nucleoside triphosphate pyrophosphohydrolase [Bacteroidota bacterium]|nr:nucleoside triphosphate pyrophosphohydrolase [Bacteroidota bacterium]MDP3144925.1 nucleoside triphosphate pyrophosphohydrolase [Bacteroidota bacterium]MDP3557062.1 nucleoside triphosphate pyrophosphohydrolase [Bacteroidota bacterium]